MLTPRFSVSQDANHVIVDVWLTGVCRLDLAEATVEDDTLLLTCEPYFLRLHLTGPCVDSDSADAQSLRCPSFDADTGQLTLLVRKAQPGLEFPDLGMLTALLSGHPHCCSEGKRQPRTSALVQELLSGEEPPSSRWEAIDQLDWFAEQPETPPPDASAAIGSGLSVPGAEGANSAAVTGGGLGFAFRRRDEQSVAMLRGVDHQLPGLVSMTHAERLAAKEALEERQFDADYYLADLMEPSDLLTQTLAQSDLQPSPALDVEERRGRMLTLPRRPQLPLEDDWEVRVTGLALADLLFAFCLDWRICEGEQTSESARSVLTQAACLSCQCPLASVPQLLRSCYRRALCYGLLRSWRLCRRVARDAARLLGNKELAVDCLLRLVRLFGASGDSGGFAAVNHLVLADMCLWLQRCPQAQLARLSDCLLAGVASFSKEDAGLGLPEWELVANMQAAELA